ncbi:hypothetical protein LO39_15775, partial [Salmonella enterica]|uniref:hypothetical protein n=1 Tax=Salmonella enterica TaxID=28901 RepID=UPI000D90C815
FCAEKKTPGWFNLWVCVIFSHQFFLKKKENNEKKKTRKDKEGKLGKKKRRYAGDGAVVKI